MTVLTSASVETLSVAFGIVTGMLLSWMSHPPPSP